MTSDIFLQNSLSFSGFNAIIEIQRYATKSIPFFHVNFSLLFSDFNVGQLLKS